MATLPPLISGASEKKGKSKKKLVVGEGGQSKEETRDEPVGLVVALGGAHAVDNNPLNGSGESGPMKTQPSREKLNAAPGNSSSSPATVSGSSPSDPASVHSPRLTTREHILPAPAANSPKNAARKRAVSAKEPNAESALHAPSAVSPRLDDPSVAASTTKTESAHAPPTLQTSSSLGSMNSHTSPRGVGASPLSSPLNSPTSSRHSTQPLDSSSSNLGSPHSEASPGSARRHPHAERHQLGEKPPSTQELRLSRNDHAHDKLVQFFGDPHVVQDCAKQGWAPQPRHVREMKLRQRFGEEIPFHHVSPQKARPKPANHKREHSSDSESFSTDIDPDIIAKERELRSSHKVHRFFGEHTAGSDSIASLARPKSSPSLNLPKIPAPLRHIDSKSLEQGETHPEHDEPPNDSIVTSPKHSSSHKLLSPRRSEEGAGAGHSFASALSPRRFSHHSPHRSKKREEPIEDELEESEPSIQPANVDVLKLNKFFGRRVNIVKVDISHPRQKRSGSRDDTFFKTAMEISRGFDESAASSLVSEYGLMTPCGEPSGDGDGHSGIGGGSNYLASYDYGRCSSSSERARRSSDSEERPESPALVAAAAEYAARGMNSPYELEYLGKSTSKSRLKAASAKKAKTQYSDSITPSTSSPVLRSRKSSKSLKKSPSSEHQPQESTSTSASKTSAKSIKSSSSSRKSSKHKLEPEENTELPGAGEGQDKDKEFRKMERRSTLTHLATAKETKKASGSALTTSSAQESHKRVDSSGGSDDELRLEQVRESHRNRKLRRMFGEDITHTDVQTAPQANWSKLNRQFTFGRSGASGAPPPQDS